MTDQLLASRRRLLTASLASFGVSALGLSLRASTRADPLALLTPTPTPMRPIVAAIASPVAINSPLAIAQAGLERAGDHITERDLVGVADFGRPSAQPRLHLVDIATGNVTSLLVAHGRGSDPAHTGWLKAFSNNPGSDATSQGAYLTGEYYQGEHGRSLRLIGLDRTNCNALARAIVIHSASYVGHDVARAQGMIGRSEGCFAVSQVDLAQVLERLGPGHLLMATKI